MFLKVKVGSYLIFHGYDAQNQELVETVTVDTWSEKIIALDRIQSITETYILTTAAGGRSIYWEYEGNLEEIAQKLEAFNLLIG